MSDPAFEAVSKARRQTEGGNPEGACTTLQEYLSKDPGCSKARLELARVLIYELDRKRDGIEQLDILLAEDPANLDALKAAATVKMSDKKFRDEVDDYYKKIIALTPEKDRKGYAKVCAAYAVFLRAQMVDFPASGDYYEKAIAYDPDAYEYHQDYAVLLLNDLKDYVKAKHELEEVMRLKPNSLSARKNYDLLMKTKFDKDGNPKKKGLFRH